MQVSSVAGKNPRKLGGEFDVTMVLIGWWGEKASSESFLPSLAG